MDNFKIILKSIGKRLSNTGSIVAIVGSIVLILNEFGLGLDNTKIMNVVNAICYILVTLGILNDSTSKGMYVPGVNDKILKESKTQDAVIEEDLGEEIEDDTPQDF